MSSIENYKLIPLKYNERLISYTVFAKEHSIRSTKKNPCKLRGNGHTIFLLNIPPYIGENELKYCFEKFGQIQSISFVNKFKKSTNDHSDEGNINEIVMNNNDDIDNKDIFIQKKSILNQFKAAYIDFKTKTSCTEALKLNELHMYNEETGIGIIKSGLKKWMSEYIDNIIDEDVLQNDIDTYIKNYNEKILLQKEIDKSNQIDEGGWITVTSRKRTKSNDGHIQKDDEDNDDNLKIKKKKKDKELKNFYTFQIKESKMKNIINLRMKFEEDKQKLEVLKKSRKFKPF